MWCDIGMMIIEGDYRWIQRALMQAGGCQTTVYFCVRERQVHRIFRLEFQLIALNMRILGFGDRCRLVFQGPTRSGHDFLFSVGLINQSLTNARR